MFASSNLPTANRPFSHPESRPSDAKQQRPSLLDLINTYPETTCPSGFALINDTILPEHVNWLTASNFSAWPMRDGATLIPPVIHITARTRCALPIFVETINQWRFANHSLLVHNDAAMDRLLTRHWPEFPQLQHVMACSISGAAKADIWRALVLWEYGGVYTDFDNAPGTFRGVYSIAAIANQTGIHLHGDLPQAFFVVERDRYMSQYFMAAAPHHPLMFLLVQAAMHHLLELTQVGEQFVPVVTGPDAIWHAFRDFMNAQGPNKKYILPRPIAENRPYQDVEAGHYVGLDKWTVTVLGHWRRSNDIVRRDVIGHQKRDLYKSMNMTHFHQADRPQHLRHASCWQILYRHARDNMVA